MKKQDIHPKLLKSMTKVMKNYKEMFVNLKSKGK